ncbi:MAG: hypothetical protein WC133_02180 [Candidatus Omnitrophota bacterium]
MVNPKHVIPAEAGIQKRGSPLKACGDDKINGMTMNTLLAILVFSMFLAGCSAPPAQIPDLPKDHPAQKFYQAAQTGMLADRVCRDNLGDPLIPIGKIEKGEGYTKLGDLTAGVFYFRDNARGKKYLGVSFLQYSGFLQMPKVCAWEEKN